MIEIKGKQYIRQELGDYFAVMVEVGKRNLPRSGRLKRALLRKYGWVCQECGATEKLEAHHIEPIEYKRSVGGYLYQDTKGNHSIENGKLLCHGCHAREHNNMGA